MDTTLVGILVSGMGALSSAIVFLWRRIESIYKETKEDLKQCEADKRQLWERVAKLEGKAAGGCDDKGLFN